MELTSFISGINSKPVTPNDQLRLLTENRYTLDFSAYQGPSTVTWTPHMDCVMSGWTSIGNCSRVCGGGTMIQTRSISQLGNEFGKPCSVVLNQTIACNDTPCQTCEVQWRNASECCNNGQRDQIGMVIVAPTGDETCPPLHQSIACESPMCPSGAGSGASSSTGNDRDGGAGSSGSAGSSSAGAGNSGSSAGAGSSGSAGSSGASTGYLGSDTADADSKMSTKQLVLVIVLCFACAFFCIVCCVCTRKHCNRRRLHGSQPLPSYAD